jgi:citrate lyase subunit beta / citryl-CoA lyase
VATIHRVLTPGEGEVGKAREIVAAFEAARAEGRDRALVDGLWVEPPAYLDARRLLERARRLGACGARDAPTGTLGRHPGAPPEGESDPA